jgi:hypothetical protein
MSERAPVQRRGVPQVSTPARAPRTAAAHGGPAPDAEEAFARLERAARHGHHFGAIPTHAPTPRAIREAPATSSRRAAQPLPAEPVTVRGAGGVVQRKVTTGGGGVIQCQGQNSKELNAKVQKAKPTINAAETSIKAGTLPYQTDATLALWHGEIAKSIARRTEEGKKLVSDAGHAQRIVVEQGFLAAVSAELQSRAKLASDAKSKKEKDELKGKTLLAAGSKWGSKAAAAPAAAASSSAASSSAASSTSSSSTSSSAGAGGKANK